MAHDATRTDTGKMLGSENRKTNLSFPPVWNYDYCKGCGTCAFECPVDAIEMVPEKEAASCTDGDSPEGGQF